MHPWTRGQLLICAMMLCSCLQAVSSSGVDCMPEVTQRPFDRCKEGRRIWELAEEDPGLRRRFLKT